MITVKQAYKKFLKEKKQEGILSSAFIMAEPKQLKDANWQLDFYNKEKDTINSYLIKEDSIEEVNIEAKPFREKEQEINELNLNKVGLTAKEAYEIAKKEVNESVSRIILLLQNLEKPVWNISFFTQAFNLINIKIDPNTKEILEKTTAPLIQF